MQRSNFESCWTKLGFWHFAANNLSLAPHHVDHFYNLVKHYHIVSSLTSETIYIVKYRSWTIVVFRLVIISKFGVEVYLLPHPPNSFHSCLFFFCIQELETEQTEVIKASEDMDSSEMEGNREEGLWNSPAAELYPSNEELKSTE